MFTYRTQVSGISSKEALARINPLVSAIKPLTKGEVYTPLPCYSQSAHRLDEIIMEVAAILNPERFPGYKLKFFSRLPEKERGESAK